MKSYVFKVVVEDDEHEDGRKAYQAHCAEIEIAPLTTPQKAVLAVLLGITATTTP